MIGTVDRRVGGFAIAKSSVLNLLAQGLPLVLGIWALPFLLRHLGPERFALFSYTLVLYGNMSLFELGLGRSLTKRTAELFGVDRPDEVLDTLWTCVALQVGLGMAAGVFLASTSPLWLRWLTKDSTALFREARLAVCVAAAFLPFALPSLAFRGTLESLQRFDLVNIVRAPQLCALFLFPVAACIFRGGLASVVAAVCSVWVLASIAYFLILNRVLPLLLNRPRLCREEARQLLCFGGWVTVSSALSPVFTHFERLALGFSGGLAVVSTYVLPAEALQRLSVAPQALVSALFPAFSGLEASGRSDDRARLYGASLKILFALVGLAVLLFVSFAHQILRLWLGKDFPITAITASQILALSMLVNCITWLPFSLLHGLGRPDLTAKYHLLEVAPYVLISATLVIRLGVVGAALGVFTRVLVDATLQFRAVHKLGLSALRPIEAGALLVVTLLLAAAIPLSSISNWTPHYGLVAAAGFCVVWWRWVLNHADRAAVLSIGTRIARRQSSTDFTIEPTDA